MSVLTLLWGEGRWKIIYVLCKAMILPPPTSVLYATLQVPQQCMLAFRDRTGPDLAFKISQFVNGLGEATV